jgi:hypothetical protein
MSTPKFDRDYISSWTKRQLGYPTLNVELTDDQLNDCIDKALDEVAPWAVQPTFITVPVSECIDLSQYDISAAYVINVHKTDVGYRAENNGPVDVFNPMSYYNVLGSRALIYDVTERIFYDKSNGAMKDNISFRYIKPKLYLDIGYPSSVSCVIEYSPSVSDVSAFEADEGDNRMYRKYVKGFTLAFARKILAEVRGKYTVDGSPVTLDADNQESRADTELDNLRTELSDTVNSQFIMD